MLFMAGLLFLVIAVSLDGFTVGLAYGMQRIRIPLSSLAMIMLLSGSIVFISMTLSALIQPYISPDVAEQIGGAILIILGTFSLWNILYNGQQKAKHESFPNIRTILVKPEKVDLDQSGTISLQESILLGIALSLDAFGAGFAAALLNYSPLLTTVLIATFSGLFVYSGMSVGRFLAHKKGVRQMIYAPGLLLITIGLIAFL